MTGRNESTHNMASRLGRILLAALLYAGLVHAASAYSAAAAIVTDVSGTTTPPLSIHQEVAPGTSIALRPGARVSLLHYTSCSIVTLKGGKATVTADGVDANPGDVESDTPGPCPKVHKIAHQGPGPLGGVVVTRGAPTPPIDVAPDALIVLSGEGFIGASSADVLDINNNPVGSRVAVQGQSFKLDGALPTRRAYILRVSFKGRSDTVELPFSISARTSGGLVVLQLD
jgi:hypothetical protein